MAYDTKGPADVLRAILVGLSGIGMVQYGVPKFPSSQVGAYLTIGSQTTAARVTGTTRRGARYFVAFYYRLDGAEEAAEIKLMGLVDAFLAALYADMRLAGTCNSIEIDTGLADAPEYIERTVKEFREYPILITAFQDGSYTVSP